MFSSFQSNAFQNNAFQILRGGSTPTVIVESRGGFNENDYQSYRRHLEALTRVTSEDRKYPKRAEEAAQAVQELPLDLVEVKKLTQEPELKGTLRLTPQIDYAALDAEIALIKDYLDKMNEYRLNFLRMEMEADDEMAFLLMMQ